MRLARRRRLGPLISMTPLIDVMFILLVFFMVTSTFLDLDMIPLVGSSRPTADQRDAPAAKSTSMTGVGSFMVRLSADGRAYVSGRPVDPTTLQTMVSTRAAAGSSKPVLVLSSGFATTQALVSLMDLLAQAGAQDVRVVRIEAQ
ncbi:biopolymer transporter ExbD [Pelagibius sp. Alg239-R121]|uniref:ExbD/TolR family protein n=1 Tax=Pelagibius sp. Alg239-R121 TaxID=2993448 RepID=UPI0024A6F993|nr:biopolymer transporter ExbD [Pelagibius sp. Alg239-R121]